MYTNTNDTRQDFDLEYMLNQSDFFSDELETINIALNDFESEKQALLDVRH